MYNLRPSFPRPLVTRRQRMPLVTGSSERHERGRCQARPGHPLAFPAGAHGSAGLGGLAAKSTQDTWGSVKSGDWMMLCTEVIFHNS